jgi:membrane protein
MTAATHTRGWTADGPRDTSKRGWLEIAKRVGRQVKKDNLPVIAAGVAFYGLLAIFPGLVALVGIVGLVVDPAKIQAQVQTLGAVLPPQASEVLLGQLDDLTGTSRRLLGLGAAGGLLLALWGASAAIRTLMRALNVVFDTDEDRGTLRFHGTALLLTLGAILALVVAIGLVVALPPVLGFLGLGGGAETAVSLLRWPILALLAVFGFAVAYRYGPSRRPPGWRWVSAGAITGVLLWITGSVLFSVYVTHFGNYNKTYGSAAAIVILLLWFLLSSYSLLVGAEINAEGERQARRRRADSDGA